MKACIRILKIRFYKQKKKNLKHQKEPSSIIACYYNMKGKKKLKTLEIGCGFGQLNKELSNLKFNAVPILAKQQLKKQKKVAR